jgi:hypothetical protein
MVVPYSIVGDAFQPEKPRPWSEQRIVPRQRAGPTRSFDLLPTGDRVVMAVADGRAETVRDKIVFVFDFFDELRRLAPVGR